MRRIILASGSPRRKELLEKYNLNPIIIKSNIIEKENPGETPEQVTMTLALHKALSIYDKFYDEIIIGADTVVVHEGNVLGKPSDSDDAFNMLSKLSGSYHEVITGFALINAASKVKVVDYERTIVKFRKLDEDKIRRYIATQEPFDKAGAYGIQGLGAVLVEKIDGCYSNVVGLPLSKIDFLLNKYFNFNIL